MATVTTARSPPPPHFTNCPFPPPVPVSSGYSGGDGRGADPSRGSVLDRQGAAELSCVLLEGLRVGGVPHEGPLWEGLHTHPSPFVSPRMVHCGSVAPDPLDSGGFVRFFPRWTKVICWRPRSHPGRPPFVQLGQVVQMRRLLDDIIHLFRHTHPPVGINISSFQFGLHSLPNTHGVRVPFLHSYE